MNFEIPKFFKKIDNETVQCSKTNKKYKKIKEILSEKRETNTDEIILCDVDDETVWLYKEIMEN